MNVILHNKEIPVEIMDTPTAISTGMMGRDNLEGGMLFIFDAIGERSFWMKDCIIPLDIAFIVKSKVSKVYYNCPPCNKDKCKSYYGIADKVLEFPAGKYEISQGNTIELG